MSVRDSVWRSRMRRAPSSETMARRLGDDGEKARAEGRLLVSL